MISENNKNFYLQMSSRIRCKLYYMIYVLGNNILKMRASVFKCSYKLNCHLILYPRII